MGVESVSRESGNKAKEQATVLNCTCLGVIGDYSIWSGNYSPLLSSVALYGTGHMTHHLPGSGG